MTRETELMNECLELRAALKKAYHELNTIMARDGVPYCYDGRKSDVTAEYFSEVVDECFRALRGEVR